MTMSDRPDPTDRTDRVEHRMERTYTTAATPEQVWEAIATADGISVWMVPTHLEPRIGGAVSFDFGDMASTGVVTDYTPNTRFAYEEPWPIAERTDDVPAAMLEWMQSVGISIDDVHRGLPAVSPIATEFLVESESGGSTVVRVVSSAYGTGAEWEREFFTEMVAGWAEILDKLVEHLDRVAA